MNILARVRLHYVVAAIVLLASVPLFQALVPLAAAHPYAGHVVLVPFLGAALLWIERWRLRARHGHEHAGGIVFTGLAVALLAVGYGAASVPLQVLSFVLAVAGLSYWRYGLGGVRTAGFALAFLLFMVPPPREAVSALAPAVQRLVASFSSVVVEALGIPVEQQGTVLLLPGLVLEVAEECAGLRFLLILLVFVTAFARIVLPTLSSQVALMALSIPVAVLANAMRVAVTSAGAYVIGPQVITGPLHFYIGKAFWALALCTMIALARQLRSRTLPVVADSRRPNGAWVAGAP